MVKIDNLNSNQNQKNQTECGFETKTQSNNQTPNNQKSGMITMLGQLLPLAPFVYEQFTGQKVPQMSGTIAEMQTALLQIQSGLQTIVNNQQSLNQRLNQLETNATNQFTNLAQAFQSLRLTHTREKKQIDFNRSQPAPETEEEQY